MQTGTADVVWRGLSAAAITRYSRQVTISDDDTTDAGYGMQVQTGTRVLMLAWSPTSAPPPGRGSAQRHRGRPAG